MDRTQCRCNGKVRHLETPTQSAAPSERLPAVPWGVPAVMAALALPLALWGWSLAVALAQDAPDELSDGEVIVSLVFAIVLDFVFIGLAAALSLWRYRLGWGALGIRRFDRTLWWWPLVAAAAAHVAIIAYASVLWLIGGEGAAPEQDLDQLFDSRAVLPLTAVATVVMAPLAEEIFFRGFVFAGLLRPLGLWGAMAASGLLFGAFHITGTESAGLVVPFGAIGMLFAWLYHRTGSLWPSIGTHFVFNLVSFAVMASMAGSVSL